MIPWRIVRCRPVGIIFLALALASGRAAEVTSSNSEPLNVVLIYSGNLFHPGSVLQDQA